MRTDTRPTYTTPEVARHLSWETSSITNTVLRRGLPLVGAGPARHRWTVRDVAALDALLRLGMIGPDRKRSTARDTGAVRRVWDAVHDPRLRSGTVAVVPHRHDRDARFVTVDDVPGVTRDVDGAYVIDGDTIERVQSELTQLRGVV